MAANLLIGPAAATDRKAILAMVAETFAAGDTYPYAPDIPPAQIEAIWWAPSHRVYSAKDEQGRTVGTFYIRPNQPGLGDHICNAGFVVAGHASGRGIGTALGRFALGEARTLGYTAMQFNLVVASNHASLRIWEKLGFSRLGLIPEAFRHKKLGLVDALVLHRKL